MIVDLDRTLRVLRDLRQLMTIHGESEWASRLSEVESQLFSEVENWPKAIQIIRGLKELLGGPGEGGLQEFDFKDPHQASYAAHLNRFEDLRHELGDILEAALAVDLPGPADADPQL